MLLSKLRPILEVAEMFSLGKKTNPKPLAFSHLWLNNLKYHDCIAGKFACVGHRFWSWCDSLLHDSSLYTFFHFTVRNARDEQSKKVLIFVTASWQNTALSVLMLHWHQCFTPQQCENGYSVCNMGSGIPKPKRVDSTWSQVLADTHPTAASMSEWAGRSFAPCAGYHLPLPTGYFE